MKLIKFLIIIFLLSTLQSNGQSFNGIGEIKLGKTFEQIQSALGVTVYTINENKNKVKEFKKNKNVLEKIPSEFAMPNNPSIFKIDKINSSYNWPEVSYNADAEKFDLQEVELYYLPRFKIASTEAIHVYLTFKYNKLVSIEMYPTEDLMQAIKNKYKPTSQSITEDTISCTYVFTGASTKHKTIHETAEWKGETNYCDYYYIDDYSSKCKPMLISRLRCYDIIFHNLELQKKETEIEKRKQEDKNKIRALKDSL
jgi:hypothetical protein